MEKELEELFVDGQMKLMDGDLDESICIFTRILEKDPDAGKAYQARAIAYLKKGDQGQALRDIDAAVAREPQNSRYHYHKAGMLMQKGELDKAFESVSRAIELDSAYPSAYLLRSRIREMLADLDGANADLNMAQQLKKAETKCVEW